MLLNVSRVSASSRKRILREKLWTIFSATGALRSMSSPYWSRCTEISDTSVRARAVSMWLCEDMVEMTPKKSPGARMLPPSSSTTSTSLLMRTLPLLMM